MSTTTQMIQYQRDTIVISVENVCSPQRCVSCDRELPRVPSIVIAMCKRRAYTCKCNTRYKTPLSGIRPSNGQCWEPMPSNIKKKKKA